MGPWLALNNLLLELEIPVRKSQATPQLREPPSNRTNRNNNRLGPPIRTSGLSSGATYALLTPCENLCRGFLPFHYTPFCSRWVRGQFAQNGIMREICSRINKEYSTREVGNIKTIFNKINIWTDKYINMWVGWKRELTDSNSGVRAAKSAINPHWTEKKPV